MNPTEKHLRSRKLINPRLQLRLIGTFAAISALGFLLQALLLGSKLTALAESLPTGGSTVLAEVPATLMETLLVSFLVLLPLTLGVGTLVTFKIAGPLYSMEQHLRRIVRGEAVGPCRVRKGDELQGFVAQLNEALDVLRAGSRAEEEGGAQPVPRDRAA